MKEQKNLEKEVNDLLNSVLEVDKFDLNIENDINKVDEVSNNLIIKNEKNDIDIKDIRDCQDLLKELRYSIEDKELKSRYAILNKRLNDLKRPALKKLDDRKKLHKKALDLSTKLIYIIEDYKIDFLIKLKNSIKESLTNEDIDLFMLVHNDIVNLDFIDDREKNFNKVKNYIKDFNINYDKYYFENKEKFNENINQRKKASKEDVQDYINKQLEKFYLLNPDMKQFNFKTSIEDNKVITIIE